jgi:hypothetical protein
MTELREQLLSARDQYRCVRYPGDLASDVLPPHSAAPAPRPWALHPFVVRLAGFAFAAAAVVAVVFVRPPSQATTPGPLADQPRVAGERAVASRTRRGESQPWRFPPDLTFASTAAERVKTVASRVQMRITLPYRDLRMPTMPELPTLPWPADWSRTRDRGDNPQAPDDPDTSPKPGPATQQSV